MFSDKGCQNATFKLHSPLATLALHTCLVPPACIFASLVTGSSSSTTCIDTMQGPLQRVASLTLGSSGKASGKSPVLSLTVVFLSKSHFQISVKINQRPALALQFEIADAHNLSSILNQSLFHVPLVGQRPSFQHQHRPKRLAIHNDRHSLAGAPFKRFCEMMHYTSTHLLRHTPCHHTQILNWTNVRRLGRHPLKKDCHQTAEANKAANKHTGEIQVQSQHLNPKHAHIDAEKISKWSKTKSLQLVQRLPHGIRLAIQLLIRHPNKFMSTSVSAMQISVTYPCIYASLGFHHFLIPQLTKQ